MKTWIEKIEIDLLKVDDTYQRTLTASGMNLFKGGFLPELAGLPLVGRRADGSLWIVDGQRRHYGAKKHGVTTLRCEVFDSTGPDQESGLFWKRNRLSGKVSGNDTFRAKLVEGDAEADDIQRAVEAAGFAFAFRGKNHEWPNVGGVGAFERAYSNGGVDRIEEMLTFVKMAWPKDSNALSQIFLDGLREFFRRYGGKFNAHKLALKISSKKTPGQLQAELGPSGRQRSRKIAEAIAEVHDSHRNTGRLLD